MWSAYKSATKTTKFLKTIVGAKNASLATFATKRTQIGRDLGNSLLQKSQLAPKPRDETLFSGKFSHKLPDYTFEKEEVAIPV